MDMYGGSGGWDTTHIPVNSHMNILFLPEVTIHVNFDMTIRRSLHSVGLLSVRVVWFVSLLHVFHTKRSLF